MKPQIIVKVKTTKQQAANSLMRIQKRQPRSSLILVVLLQCAILSASLIGFLEALAANRSIQVAAASKRQLGYAEKDFAPKLIHQPPSVHLPPNKPHTIECAVEARPEAEVKWFKDEQVLLIQPPHLEQSGNELMFFQINEHDIGQYHCQATNYLGSVSSEPLTLTVQSSIHEPRIRFEPSSAEVGRERQAKFTCTIPLRRNQRQLAKLTRDEQQRIAGRLPEVSWRRNGRPLRVRWLQDGSNEAKAAALAPIESIRYLARRTSPGELVLTIANVQPEDDNSTYTCLYKWPDYGADDEDSPSLATLNFADGPEESVEASEELARESSPVRLRVFENSSNQVKLDVNLAPPIDNLPNSKNPHELPGNRTATTTTTQLGEPIGRMRNSLRQTLEDLFELAKPMLIIVGLLSLMSSIVLLHLALIKRKSRNQNRYMKHQYVGSGASSGASSAIGGVPDCGDPVLSSLMARTLSAPSAASLAGATKKYRSYRDHLRKVAAVQDMVVSAEGDFVDGYYGPPMAAQLRNQQQQQFSGSLSDHEPFFALPNLYNQSLAAREQARSLLQANEHVRSMSNLSQHQKQQGVINPTARQHQQQLGAMGQLGSHLNLPLSFALGGANGRSDHHPISHSNLSSAFWPAHLAASAQQHAMGGRSNHQQQTSNQQSKHRLAEEHYQLVNCSSISPSSSNSGAISSSNSTNDRDNRRVRSQNEFGQPNSGRLEHQCKLDCNSLNHYSTIETNDEEDRYEELEQNQPITQDNRSTNQQGSFRTAGVSTFVPADQQHEPVDGSSNNNHMIKNSIRSSIMSNSSSSGCGDSTNTTTNSSMSGELAINRFGSKRTERQQHHNPISQQDNKRFQDQLSPYAVSSICSSIPPNHQPPNHQPPPVPDSEAMRALYEQFDINRLMLLDEANSIQQVTPFDALPPPPPPPTSSDSSSLPQTNDRAGRSQTRKNT